VGDDALGIVNRGSHNTLTAYPGKAFDNNYTLNTVDVCPVGALTSKDFRFQMRVWFLKETKSICTSCATGCNIIIGSREEKIYRYEPRENDAVNSCWMCDYGRLKYKWIGREDRLVEVQGPKSKVQSPKAEVHGPQSTVHSPPEVQRPRSEGQGQGTEEVRDQTPEVRSERGSWGVARKEISQHLGKAARGSVAIVASARQTNEELYLLGKLARKCGALTDSFPRMAEGDKLILNADRNPNSAGARLIGVAADPMGANLSRIAEGIRGGQIKTLIVFGEDVTKCGIGAELLTKLDLLIVSDILPNATTRMAHYLLPGCAQAEKRGTFTSTKGRVQKFMKAIEPRGDARPEWEFLHDLVLNITGQDGYVSIEGLFNQMAKEVPAFNGLTWAALGDTGVTVPL